MYMLHISIEYIYYILLPNIAISSLDFLNILLRVSRAFVFFFFYIKEDVIFQKLVLIKKKKKKQNLHAESSRFLFFTNRCLNKQQVENEHDLTSLDFTRVGDFTRSLRDYRKNKYLLLMKKPSVSIKTRYITATSYIYTSRRNRRTRFLCFL